MESQIKHQLHPLLTWVPVRHFYQRKGIRVFSRGNIARSPRMTRTGDHQIVMAIGQWIRAGLEDSSKKNTIPILDGVRAFACLIVIWFHIYRIPRDMHVWKTQPSVHPLLNSFLFFGKYGVTLFFVLSGFLLFLPFAKALLFEKT